ncbi:MAG: phosphoribosylaminoimidazolesuccinocarboxamide synthase [Cyclobacteriaceae bacterium]
MYVGKVRDVYIFDKKIAIVATDRISAFDVILPRAIPYKGQVLNQVASMFLNRTRHIVPNWLESTPEPNLSIGKKCKPFAVEMVIRGFLTGHAWREYREGKRTLCGVSMPEGMRENDPFPEPILTPSTKADEGHDEDITRNEIISKGIVSEEKYLQLEKYTKELFAAGSQFANDRGLILVDTKYEFGEYEGEIYLIDEIHTPDSSRYFYKDSYQELQRNGEPQKQLSKEFVRQWLIANGFQGQDGQTIPEMTDELVASIADRYIELYEKITGEQFVKDDYNGKMRRIETQISKQIS